MPLAQDQPIRVRRKEFDAFYELNIDFDLLTFDFLDSATVAQCDWPDGIDVEFTKSLFMTYQRLLRVHPNTFVADRLLERGFDSAQKIASVSEAEFVVSNADVFGDDTAARRAHQKALTVRGQTTHLWANIHSLVASKHSREMRSLNINDDVVEFFASLPTYEDLFSTLDYCECEHCKSIFGPAAYFVDLMRITERYVTKPNESTIPPDMTLKSRRKGLFELPLTCANTNDLVPYIQIVNEVLAERAAHEMQSADIYNTLANTVYPFNLPANTFLEEIRSYVGLLESSLAEIYAVFAPVPDVGLPPNIAIARASLKLSLEQCEMVTTPTTEEARLKEYYGLANQGLSSLDNEPFFLLQTGLTRDSLNRLLYDNLDEDEVSAGLAHGFLINLPLPDSDFVNIVTPTEGDRTIQNLNPDTLDRINRFVRLSQWTGIPFADLDWLLNSAGATDISEDSIRKLAQIQQARAVYGLPPDTMSAFWADMKTIGVGKERYPEDLFDTVYNHPSLLQGEKPYHPVYAKNPLYTDPVQTWDIDSTERVESVFGRARLMAALGVSDTELTAIGNALFGPDAEVRLDMPNLSQLYRTTLILRSLKLSLEDYLILLSLLNIERENAYTPKNLIRLHTTAVWLRLNRLSIPELNYILTGTTDKTTATEPVDYSFMRGIWVLNQPKLLQPDSFAADLITSDRSADAFEKLLGSTDPQWIVSVEEDYKKVFGTPPNTKVAIVLKPATAAGLRFLKEADFSDDQIKIIVQVLLRAYEAQIVLLNTQFATLLRTTSEVLDGLRYYVASVPIDISTLVQLLLTPAPECSNGDRGSDGKCEEFSTAWQAIVKFVHDLSRATFTATSLDLDKAELVSMADHPSVYDIQDRLTLTLDVVRSVLSLKALKETFDASQQEFLDFFAMPSDTDCAAGEKSAALAELTGWKQPQICRVAEDMGEGTSIYDTVSGVVRLKRGFDMLSRTGMDAFFVHNLRDLRDLPASAENWPTYRDTARSLVAVANAKYASTWDEVNGKVVSTLNEFKRNALEWLVLWKLRQGDATFIGPRQLYDFLLIDVEMSGCAQVSCIVEGLNAVQLYLQRARLNLEYGVNTLPIPEVWWEWMMNYRVWEANRKIFLYPENYLIPSIRQSKTTLFKALHDRLQQSDVTKELVEAAFLEYIEGFTALTTLTYVDAYQGIVEDGEREPVETIFLFGRTRAEPYTYYYNTKEKDATWGEWRKIDIAIASRYITPVYALSRLFIFWIELTPTSSSEITTESDKTISKNQGIYTAAIRYSFYGFAKNWSAPQTLREEEVVYVEPSTTPFDDASGYQLFSMNNLYWQKVNAIRITGENLTGPPENTSATEKLIVFYGPFLENNIAASPLNVPLPPDSKDATENQAKYKFDVNVYNRTVDVNQAISGSVRGSISLNKALILNSDLNLDFLMRSTEFLLSDINRSAGIPPAVEPTLDVALSSLNISETLNVLRTNYYGDYTSDISTAVRPSPVDKTSFESPPISQQQSTGVYNDLSFHDVLFANGQVSPKFSLNTDLTFLFGGAPPDAKAILIPVVQEMLLVLRARDEPAAEGSFVVPGIDTAASGLVHGDLVAHGIIDDSGYVEQTLTSKTDLSFLFAGAPPEEKQLLISEVRRVLFRHLGEPVLLVNTAKDIASTIMVKNQPGAFIFNNGDEAFHVVPDTERLPAISSLTRVSDVSTEPTVFDYSFVTANIDPATSQEAFNQLKENHILGPSGKLSSDFGPLTDLSFLFPNTGQPRRAQQIAEVREKLLNLPSITALQYYFESEELLIDDRSFITYGIDATASATVFAQLQQNEVVGPDGFISKRFSATTDLSYLFPDDDPVTRERLTEEVRRILLSYYASTWQRNIHDLKFLFTRLTTGAVSRLSSRLFSGGVDRLLSLQTQQIPVVPELPFTRYAPSRRVIPPGQFDGAQVDFNGPYGLYYWELFFFAPQLIATSLLTERRFDEALQWYQYIFNPTVRERPLSAKSFMTPDISRTEAEQAYEQLQQELIITPKDQVSKDFDNDTYLGFLWPRIPAGEEKDLMIHEVRNVLLNFQLSRPSARFWQFQPFRNHTLQELKEILSDETQIRIYNNNPFDPYAIARLRIGSFEKATVMNYLDNLIDWGDAMFVQYTWEGLTAAQMLYDYAYNLLGEKPVNVGPCSSQPPTTFQEILDKYEDQRDGIPQFLIYMENFIWAHDLIAPELDGKPFTDVDPYFCVPENAQMLAYWDRIEDRLYKIRHCLDLEGKPLELPLFAPPIDPLELVRAAAAGRSSTTVIEQQLPSIPPYKFSAMADHTRLLVNTVSQLGSALQVALSSRDTEALARLQNSHEQTILNLTTRLKQQQIESTQFTLESLQENKNAIEARHAFYEKLLEDGLLFNEVANIVYTELSTALRSGSLILETASAIAYLVPNAGSPLAMTYGGQQTGNSLAKWAAALEVGATVADFGAEISLTVADYERRAQEWELEVEQSTIETAQLQKDVDAAQVQVRMAERELQIHQTSIAQTKEIQDFLKTKFDSQELYTWIAGRVSTLYYQAYKTALEAALATQSAYRYELNRDDTFVNFDYWDNLHQGLLAGEGLENALNQMERAFMRNNIRRFEIKKTISLAQICPVELFRLKTTGECTFSLTEALFDFDFPGHYSRQVRSVEIYLFGEEGEAIVDFNAELTQIKNDLVLKPSKEAVEYLLNSGGGSQVPPTVRQNWQSRQQIALSSDLNPGGMMEDFVNYYDDRYIPFEGTGAVSKWNYSVPPETNRFDLGTITDLTLTLTYTALNGGKTFKMEVQDLLSDEKFRGAVYMNLAEAFAEQWKEFMADHEDPDKQVLSFDIETGNLPANLKKMHLASVDFQLDVASDIQMPASSEFMSLVIGAEAAKKIVMNGRYAQVETADLPQEKFVTTWQIEVDLTAMRSNDDLKQLLTEDGFLDPGSFQDLEIILNYNACVFHCE